MLRFRSSFLHYILVIKFYEISFTSTGLQAPFKDSYKFFLFYFPSVFIRHISSSSTTFSQLAPLKLFEKNTYIFRIELLWMRCAGGKNNGIIPLSLSMKISLFYSWSFRYVFITWKVCYCVEYKFSILNPKACLWSYLLTMIRLGTP